jgi:GTP-binding protein HflX
MLKIREQPKLVDRAWLVGVQGPGETADNAASLLQELEELVRTLGIAVAGSELVRLRQPQSRFYLGAGKTDSIIARAAAAGAQCIVIDAELSPAQQRNWEKACELWVIDRQEVILDIFHARARTREAVLQVELARSEHALPRLRNAWTHLGRQRGGGVTQRGEGEAQIELDARAVRARISRLRDELAAVVRHREQQRKQRQRIPIATAAIVGYTNAGKSTLLNALTGAGVDTADKLFATLDPTTRQLVLPGGRKLLLTDTVGFIRRLPHQLVEAFKATLEEAVVADFLIHVVDAASPEADSQHATTRQVLEEIGAGDRLTLTVRNKIDLLPAGARPHLTGEPRDVCVSARTGTGIDTLLARLDELVAGVDTVGQYLIPHARYDLLHQLHEAGGVESEKAGARGIRVRARVPPRLLARLAPFREATG